MWKDLFSQIRSTAAAHLGVREAPGVRPYILVPEGQRFLPVPEDQLDEPHHIHTTVDAFDPGAFASYFNRYKGPAARVFCDLREPSILGIMDYHEDREDPNWNAHRIHYRFRKTREWEAWTAKNDSNMQQVPFAEFLEENLPDIVRPEPISMKEMVLDLQAKRDVSWAKSSNLQNGATQFSYHENITGTGSAGLVEIPREFTIFIAPYEGTQKVEIRCRFRYSLSGTTLNLRYQMYRATQVQDAAVESIRQALQQSLSEVPVEFCKFVA